ncbi:hypothetical protein Q0590_28280 [Rhodocytophaga aerolata]|uniref:Uncharacterized protein n=1 Tax=Rhodocytophaga aerolata TaxID=455078 RepID=A0ABT8RDM8_9BACT|nr:hypothetical protein [Rhodocytophaga aerolata]MDO1450211.1 hypothetical protein [Rhodocytophaga aerolata]
MDSLVVIVDKVNDKSDQEKLNRICSEKNRDYSARVPCALYIHREGRDKIPKIAFENEETQNNFFDQFKDRSLGGLSKNEVTGITTMPYRQLKEFNDIVTSGIDNSVDVFITIKIEESYEANLSMCSLRKITFRRTGMDEISRSKNIAIEKVIEKGHEHVILNCFKEGKKIFLSPLQSKPIEDGFPTFDALFKDRNRFPIALPLKFYDDVKTYYREDQLKVRDALRKKFESYTFFKESLFFKLWKASDSPVFREFLKEGGYFTLISKGENVENAPEREGENILRFIYPGNGWIHQWRGKLLEKRASHSIEAFKALNGFEKDFEELKMAINEDLKYHFNYLEIERKSEKVESDNTWTNNDEVGYIKDARTNDHVDKILILADEIGEGNYIKNVIDVFKANNDNDGALEVFMRNFVPYPFCDAKRIISNDRNIQSTYRKEFRIIGEQNMYWAWKQCVLEMLYWQKRENLYRSLEEGMNFLFNVNTIDSNIQKEQDTYIYHKNLHLGQIMQLRLFLPEKAKVRRGVSSRIDDPQALLDKNFIIR